MRAYLGPWYDSVLTSSEGRPLYPAPGEKLNVDLGKNGAKLTGKIRLTGELPKGLDLHYSLNYLVRKSPDITFSKQWNIKPFDFSKPLSTQVLESVAARAHSTYFVKPTPEGLFQINGVPAGDYLLALRIFEKPEGCLVDPVAEKIVPISLTAAQVATGEVSLPEIEVAVNPPLKVGNPLPAASLKLADGQELRLQDFKGKYVLLHCWAGWCTVCSRSYPDLQKLASDFPKEKLSIVGLNLDTTVREGVESTSKNKFTWPQAYLAAEGGEKVIQDWQITSIPQFLLVSPEGKLVLRTWSIDEVLKVLKQKTQ